MKRPRVAQPDDEDGASLPSMGWNPSSNLASHFGVMPAGRRRQLRRSPPSPVDRLDGADRYRAGHYPWSTPPPADRSSLVSEQVLALTPQQQCFLDVVHLGHVRTAGIPVAGIRELVIDRLEIGDGQGQPPDSVASART